MLPNFEYEYNKYLHKILNILVDGIYPHWTIAVSTISEGEIKKKKPFVTAQEEIRKDVERAFGLLISLWALLTKLLTLWYK